MRNEKGMYEPFAFYCDLVICGRMHALFRDCVYIWNPMRNHPVLLLLLLLLYRSVRLRR